MNDIAYRNLFYFMFTTICHIAVPKAFPTVMLYFYLVAVVAHAALFAVGQFKFAFVTYLVMNLFVFMIIMALLVDKWCDFFQYRGNNGVYGVDD